jgi:hypothetical protein
MGGKGGGEVSIAKCCEFSLKAGAGRGSGAQAVKRHGTFGSSGCFGGGRGAGGCFGLGRLKPGEGRVDFRGVHGGLRLGGELPLQLGQLGSKGGGRGIAGFGHRLDRGKALVQGLKRRKVRRLRGGGLLQRGDPGFNAGQGVLQARQVGRLRWRGRLDRVKATGEGAKRGGIVCGRKPEGVEMRQAEACHRSKRAAENRAKDTGANHHRRRLGRGWRHGSHRRRVGFRLRFRLCHRLTDGFDKGPGGCGSVRHRL